MPPPMYAPGGRSVHMLLNSLAPPKVKKVDRGDKGVYQQQLKIK